MTTLPSIPTPIKRTRWEMARLLRRWRKHLGIRLNPAHGTGDHDTRLYTGMGWVFHSLRGPTPFLDVHLIDDYKRFYEE